MNLSRDGQSFKHRLLFDVVEIKKFTRTDEFRCLIVAEDKFGQKYNLEVNSDAFEQLSLGMTETKKLNTKAHSQ